MLKSMEYLILRLFDIGAIEFGAFEFKHHEKCPDAPLAPMKINLRTTEHPTNPGKLTPPIVFEIAVQLLELIERENIEFDYIAGIPRAGEPFAEIITKILDKPLLRIEKIDEGNRKRKIGGIVSSHEIEPRKSVLVLDDVMTRGESKGETVEAFESAGLTIPAIVCLVDREEGGMEIYTNLGYRMIAGFTATQLMEIGLANKKTTEEEFRKHQEYLIRTKQYFASIKD